MLETSPKSVSTILVQSNHCKNSHQSFLINAVHPMTHDAAWQRNYSTKEQEIIKGKGMAMLEYKAKNFKP